MKLKDIAISTRDLFMLAPDVIQEESGWNVRLAGPELDAHIRQLADSIKEIGVQEPVTVYLKNDVPILTNGHCRLMAVKLAISEGAEIAAIPARAEERYANDADRVLGMLTRNGGKPLSFLEQAEVVKRLMGYGWTDASIAKKTGYSSTHIGNLISLSAAPVEITNMVAAGEVSATLAVNTVRKEGALLAGPKLKDAVKVAKESGKSKATAKHVAKTEGKAPNKSAGPLSSNIAWDAWGPKFETAVIDIINAPGTAAQQTAIDKAAQLLEELRG